MHFEKTLVCLLKAVCDEDDRIASLVVDCAEICGILDLGLSLAIVSRVVQRHAAAGTTRAMLSVGSEFHGILISACNPDVVTSSGKHTDAKMWYDMIVPRLSSAGLTVSEQVAYLIVVGALLRGSDKVQCLAARFSLASTNAVSTVSHRVVYITRLDISC